LSASRQPGAVPADEEKFEFMARPRVFISTDLRLTSEEKDDAQSLIRALMYQDKMNIVGISGTVSKNRNQDGRVADINKVADDHG
jgi:hypothetical protein